MNTDELERQLYWAERRVREIQTKLHRWATSDPHRRFDDLYNLVCDPSFLLVAWDRVRGNTGARTAGVDGQTVHQVEVGQGVEDILDGLRVELKARSFRRLPVRERMIPKPGTTKRRRLGIPTARDRVVQASLKLVLEPIFEATLTRVPTGSARSAGPMSAWRRCTISRPAPTSGSWKETSKPASMRFRILP